MKSNVQGQNWKIKSTTKIIKSKTNNNQKNNDQNRYKLT
jgi:hypothetical protein